VIDLTAEVKVEGGAGGAHQRGGAAAAASLQEAGTPLLPPAPTNAQHTARLPAPELQPLPDFSSVLGMERALCAVLSQLEPSLPPAECSELEEWLQAAVRPLRCLAADSGRLEALKQDFWYLQRAVARQQPVAKVVAALRGLLTTAHGVLQAVTAA
jgi:1-acyl-sn-glycerol-3-phosphate acyltransferase